MNQAVDFACDLPKNLSRRCTSSAEETEAVSNVPRLQATGSYVLDFAR
jgi:hypothetical protein